MSVPLTQTLIQRLAIRLSCQKTAAKSLVISRRGERSEEGEAERTNHYASFTLKTAVHQTFCYNFQCLEAVFIDGNIDLF
jgi:hypothetical protein